jgi:ATP-dependent Clp protease adaptor protein ClpS
VRAGEAGDMEIGPAMPDSGVIELEREEVRVAQPPMYQVVMFNDDYTPAEFVVDVLQRFFQMDMDKAINFMITVHRTGKGVCGVYPKDVAETKAKQANDYATANQHPLQLQVETVD